MNKHTPGPFGLGRLTQGGPEQHGLHIPITAGSTIRIANVYARLDTHPEICPAEAMANARLFQAAPDMLKALESLADIDPHQDNPLPRAATKRELEITLATVRHIARAARDKATSLTYRV